MNDCGSCKYYESEGHRCRKEGTSTTSTSWCRAWKQTTRPQRIDNSNLHPVFKDIVDGMLDIYGRRA